MFGTPAALTKPLLVGPVPTVVAPKANVVGEQLETKYGKHCDFANFKRRNHSDILYPTCLIEIINYIVKHVKIDKDILLEKI